MNLVSSIQATCLVHHNLTDLTPCKPLHTEARLQYLQVQSILQRKRQTSPLQRSNG